MALSEVSEPGLSLQFPWAYQEDPYPIRMESRKPYQEHQINIHETGRVASKANERSGWQLNGVIDSSQGLSHLEPRPGNPIDFQSNPVAPGMVTGWPSMQHPLHGRADTTTRTDFNESYFTDSNMWNAPAQGSDCLDATNAFTNGVHEVRNRLDPFPSAFVSQGSASRNIHDRSEYMQVWPQGGNYEPRACHSGSEYRGQGNYSLPRYPIDPYVMPSGAQLPDLPILGTHSPDNIDHDSPGAPAILHKERIGSYMAQNDPWSPEKARWSANNTTTIDEGFPQTPDDPGSSQPQTHYPHGQWISLNDWWDSTLFLASKDKRLHRPKSIHSLLKKLLTRSCVNV